MDLQSSQKTPNKSDLPVLSIKREAQAVAGRHDRKSGLQLADRARNPYALGFKLRWSSITTEVAMSTTEDHRTAERRDSLHSP